jgi:hypothetical protein
MNLLSAMKRDNQLSSYQSGAGRDRLQALATQTTHPTRNHENETISKSTVFIKIKIDPARKKPTIKRDKGHKTPRGAS